MTTARDLEEGLIACLRRLLHIWNGESRRRPPCTTQPASPETTTAGAVPRGTTLGASRVSSEVWADASKPVRVYAGKSKPSRNSHKILSMRLGQISLPDGPLLPGPLKLLKVIRRLGSNFPGRMTPNGSIAHSQDDDQDQDEVAADVSKPRGEPDTSMIDERLHHQ